MEKRMERMKERMRGILGNKKEEGSPSQHSIVEDQQEILAKVTSKVVEDSKEKHGGSCKVTKTEADSKSNEQEVLSASVTAQVLSYLCNLVRYLICIPVCEIYEN